VSAAAAKQPSRLRRQPPVIKYNTIQVPKGIITIISSNMNMPIIMFLIGILGFILNRKNIILMIIAIEIMLLAVTLLVLISSFSFDDGIGQIFSIFIISVAGAESVIGLSIIVAFFRLRGNISLIN
jgi:NADH-ubiquinone oxidoreductase chain 4L